MLLKFKKHNEAHNVAIILLRKHADASMRDISSSFVMNSYSSVIMQIKQAMEGDKKLRQRMAAKGEETRKLFIDTVVNLLKINGFIIRYRYREVELI